MQWPVLCDVCSPSCWVTQYLHPYELTVVGICTTTSPWCFGAHPLTQWSFMLLCIALSVEAHVGYDLPLSLHRWLPCWGGSVKHDMHHQRPLTNYQPFFTWFDRLFDSECPGQRAAGYRPPTLVDWETRQRRAAAGTTKSAALTDAGPAEAVAVNNGVDDVTTRLLGNYRHDDDDDDDGSVVQAKRL